MKARCKWIIKDPRNATLKRMGIKIEEVDPHFKPHPCRRAAYMDGFCRQHLSYAQKDPHWQNWFALQKKLKEQREQNLPIKFKNYYWENKHQSES